MTKRPPSVTVIVPGYNAAVTLPDCLAAIRASNVTPDALIFFDDGSTDASADIARSHGFAVIRHDGAPLGPGAGRTRAARVADADILVFIDADVVMHPDAIERLVAPLETEWVAAFGSYDDRPAASNCPSLYVNLRHHFVHQQGRREASTFWAGLGAVRRAAFVAAGGFDPRYRLPSIEDIALGSQLIEQGGRIRLVPAAMGTHLKRWSLRQLWATDIFRRAIPWSRLIAQGRSSGAALNGSDDQRLSAVLAHLVPAGLILAWWSGIGVAVALAAGGWYGWCNRRFFGLLARRMSVPALLGAVGLHWLYHLYASQIFGWTMVAARLRRA